MKYPRVIPGARAFCLLSPVAVRHGNALLPEAGHAKR